VATGQRAALQIVVGQVAMAALVAAVFLVTSGAHASFSALTGGGIGAAASLAMIFAMFADSSDPKRMLSRFFRGEATKLGLTVLLFALAFKLGQFAALPLLAGYVATFVVYWIALLK